AAGVDTTLAQFHEGEHGRLGPYERDPLSPDAARAALRRLLELREQGLREPLPFGPYSGWEFFRVEGWRQRVKEASKRWHGSPRSYAEGDAVATRLAMRGMDPFADDAHLLRFANVTMKIFSAVQTGEDHPGIDPEVLKGLASAPADEEDAA